MGAKILLTRGLPSSGKSTWAKEFARVNPNVVRVSRDDLRSQLYPGADYRDIDEDLITEAEDKMKLCEMWRNVEVPTFQVGDPDVRF